jgi:hypothetical protein
MIALMRRERDRATHASPLVRARILEAIPALFPDLSDIFPAPRCDADLEHESAALLEETPLPFNRQTVARIRVSHDSKTLAALFLRDEKTIGDYQLSPEEKGPPPPKSLVRYLALGSLPAYWVMDNVAEGRRFLLERLRTSKDDREQYLLHSAATALFSGALWGHPERFQGDEAPSLLRAWLPDVERRLKGPADRVSLELVLSRLADLGTYATRFGAAREVRALCEGILAVRGELPLTQGIAGASRDLCEVARGAIQDIDAPGKPSVTGASDPLTPRHDRFNPRKDWLDLEPAGGQVSEADALARVHDLDTELNGLHYFTPRCYVIQQLGEWLPPGEAARRFDGIIAPIFEEDRIRISSETVCRMRVALELEGVDEARRVKLVLMLLATPQDKVEPRDLSGEERHAFYGWPAEEDPARLMAARSLARHLDWIDRHADLRAWLSAQALSPIPLPHAPAETWSILQPAFERAIDDHLAGGPDAAPEMGRGILKAWMDSIRAAEAARNVSHIYVGQVMRARIRALGDRGRRAGLAAEVGAFLEERKSDRTAAIAAYMLTLP